MLSIPQFVHVNFAGLSWRHPNITGDESKYMGCPSSITAGSPGVFLREDQPVVESPFDIARSFSWQWNPMFEDGFSYLLVELFQTLAKTSMFAGWNPRLLIAFPPFPMSTPLLPMVHYFLLRKINHEVYLWVSSTLSRFWNKTLSQH